MSFLAIAKYTVMGIQYAFYKMQNKFLETIQIRYHQFKLDYNYIQIVNKSIVCIFSLRTHSNNLKGKVKKIARRAKITTSEARFRQNLIAHLEELTQKITALWKRIRRYRVRSNIYQKNQLFRKDQKTFCRNLKESSNPNFTPPSKVALIQFWSNVWPKNCTYDKIF